MKQLVLPPESYFTNCFTLRWEMTEGHYHKDTTEYVPWDRAYTFDLIKVHLAKREVTGAISIMQMFFTSKANSFGAIIYQWFDGLVQPVTLEGGNYYPIQITQAREYQYLCTSKTFFECLGSNLEMHKNCVQNGDMCSPFSLPGDIPICKNEAAECWREIKEFIIPKCMTKKSCHVYEYDINKEIFVQEILMRLDNETASKILDSDDLDNTIILQLRIDHLDWSKGDWSKELSLDVYTEYYVWTGVSLIGNVGGQLGLFIGFSFLGSWVWLMSKVHLICSWVTRNDNTLK